MTNAYALYSDLSYKPFKINESQKDISLDITDDDITALRELAAVYADIALLPIHRERIKNWRNINSLIEDKPVLWIFDVPWHEMNVNHELTLKCSSDIGQRIETNLRKTIYKWKHLQSDMIVDPVYYSPFIMTNTGFGIEEQTDFLETDANNSIVSSHYSDLIQTEEDLEKIVEAKIAVDLKRTEDFFELYSLIFDGIMKVEKRGCPGLSFSPWDQITKWKGAESILLDLAVRPELMHKLIDRTVNVYLNALDQFVHLNLLARNDINVRVGSGGYGYVADLPAGGFNEAHVTPKDMWGNATPQIFSAVSPQMHEEFGIDYEKKWLDRFGLAYYGCCEPLDNKISELSKIKNLRKISISPWADCKNAAEKMRHKYVVSLKLSPTEIASPNFNESVVRREIEDKLGELKGCCIEVIINSISTVRYKPQNLWRWVDIVAEVIDHMYT